MTPDEAYAEAVRRIAHARDSAAESLDLGDLSLQRIPPEMSALVGVKIIALGTCRPTYKYGMWQLSRDYNRSNNRICDISCLASLVGLQSLDLSGCSGLSDISWLAGLTELQSFDLKSTRVSNISPIARMSKLRNLNLSLNRLLSDISPVINLTELRYLDLTSTGISNIAALAGLERLVSLSLKYTSISDISPLAGLIELHSIDLESTGVSNLESLSGLVRLRSLCLRYTGVANLSPLAELTELRTLDLESTGVSDLSPLSGIAGLKTFNLTGCKGVIVGSACPVWDSVIYVCLHRACCVDFPDELCGDHHENVIATVRGYFRDLGDAPGIDVETKLYLLGNGRVGKTKLSRRILGQEYGDDHEPSTHGVRLHSRSIPTDGVPESVRLSLWDFGGQDVYHGSHSLFLRGHAVYLILWAPECEHDDSYSEAGILLRNHRLAYWFDYLRDVAGTTTNGVRRFDDPVLLVQSRCDYFELEQPPPVELPTRDEFPRLTVLHVSAKTGHNLADLRADLGKAVRRIFTRSARPKLGPGWVRVRDAVRLLQDPDHPTFTRTLTLSEFDDLCRAGDGGVSDPSVLLRYLHETGVVFHKPGLFDGRVIVDQQWALDAVYTVSTRDERFHAHLRRTGGRFTRDDLDHFFWRDHPAADQRTFLSFMEQCGICFRASDRWRPEPEYVAPEFLAGWGPDLDRRHRRLLRAPPDAAAEVAYPLLHVGITRRFLAGLGERAGDRAEYWRFGCHFHDGGTGTEALVRVDGNTVRIEGRDGRAADLVGTLVAALRAIPTGRPPTVSWADHADEPTVPDPAREPESRPLDRIRPQFGPKSVFLSYRHPHPDHPGSERGRDLLEKIKDLVVAEGGQVVFDQTGLQTGDSISRFVEQARECRYLVAVICDRYLDSRWTLSELFAFRERFGPDARAFADSVAAVIYPEAGITDDLQRARLVRRCREKLQNYAEFAADFSLDERTYAAVLRLRGWFERLGEILADLGDRLSEPSAEAVAALLDRRFEEHNGHRKDR